MAQEMTPGGDRGPSGTNPTTPASSLHQKKAHTRIFDELVAEFGLVGAAVYGVIWRHCQMRDGVCKASYETLGDEIGVSERSVRRWVKKFKAKKLIEVTPNGRINHIHVKPLPRPESPPTPDTEAAVPRPESPTKIGLEETLEETPKASPSRQKKRRKRAPPKHPAISRFRKSAHRYPAKSWFAKIESAVGEGESALEFWEKVVFAWVGLGWRPTNVKGMLEFFERGEIPGHKNGRSKVDKNTALIDAYEAEIVND